MRVICFILFSASIAIQSVYAQSDSDNASLSSSVSTEINAVKSVNSGYRFEVKETSRGCFHHDIKTIKIAGDYASIEGGGSVVLSKSTLRHLDNYFKHVRIFGDRTRCTSTSDYEISVWDGEMLLAKEYLMDGSCQILLGYQRDWPWRSWVTPSQISLEIDEKIASYKTDPR